MSNSANKVKKALGAQELPWMLEAAKEIWPYAGTMPLQTGDALRDDIAKVIAKHYAASLADSPSGTAAETKEK
jgi:hypothetical protein